MRILIAGGSGFIGQALIDFWLADNHDTQKPNITVLGRDIPHLKQLFTSKPYSQQSKQLISYLDWQQFDKNAAEILQNHDLVINLVGANVGTVRWSKKRKQEILYSRIVNTNKIAQAIASLPSEQQPHLYNASAIGIYGLQALTQHSGLPAAFDESSEIVTPPTDFLSEIGQQWEAAAKTAGDKVTLMRFAVVLGKQGGALPMLARPFYFCAGGKIGSGQQPFTWIAIDDLVKAIDFLIKNPEITGPINLVAPRCVAQQEFAHTLAKVLHRPCFFTVPGTVLQIIFGEQMANELMLQGQHVVPSRLLEVGFEFDYPTIRIALKHIYN